MYKINNRYKMYCRCDIFASFFLKKSGGFYILIRKDSFSMRPHTGGLLKFQPNTSFSELFPTASFKRYTGKIHITSGTII